MALLRRVAGFNTPEEDQKDIHVLFIRSIHEQSATVWHSSISEENKNDLERVQKTALKVILREKYTGYNQGLAKLGLESLESRRENLCLNFANKCIKSERLKHMFPLNQHNVNTRNKETYEVQFANTGRLQKSPIIYMQKLLNEDELKKTELNVNI